MRIHHGRRGMKLSELMVAIFVVALMFFLVMSFLRRQPVGGRRLQCQSNIKQVGLGLLGYLNTHNAFPNAGTFDDDSETHGGDPKKSNIYQALMDPASIPSQQNVALHSWVVDILPHIDNQEPYDGWDRTKGYLDPSPNAVGGLSNRALGQTDIGIIRCPEDLTVERSQGNLSYVVNGGFARWPAVPVGWNGGASDGQPTDGDVLKWTAPGRPWQESQAIGQKLGVMFLGTRTGDQPWDIKTTPQSISDGAATTLLAAENTLVGASAGTRYSGNVPTNWACPLPNFCMFIASDEVCRSTSSPTDCVGGQLQPNYQRKSTLGWTWANRRGNYENINYGAGNLTVEGSFPYANSMHSGGSNFLFCDGSVRFLRETIDGTIYAKLISPAGESLPEVIRQTRLSDNEKEELD